jgi:CheY-like chemotaxis protein
MPDMDGFQLVTQIRTLPRLRETSILMLSSGYIPGDAERCSRLGAQAYLVKPVRQLDLLSAILTALEAHPSTGYTPGYRKEKSLGALNGAIETTPPAASTNAGMRVLVGEDNSVNRTLIGRLLHQQGHSVVVADNGKEVLDLLEQQAFDLILMDVQMPEMDGFEATAHIRVRERGSGTHIPIIALTAHAMSGDRERCIAAGMDDYLSKPVRPALLADAIGRVMANQTGPSILETIGQQIVRQE